MSQLYSTGELYESSPDDIYELISDDSDDEAGPVPRGKTRGSDHHDVPDDEPRVVYDEMSDEELSLFSATEASPDEEPSPADIYGAALALDSADTAFSAASFDSEDSVEGVLSKYETKLHMLGHHGEDLDSLTFARSLYDHLQGLIVAGTMRVARRRLKGSHPGADPQLLEKLAVRLALELGSPEGIRERTDEAWIRNSGWTTAEVKRHIHDGEPLAVEYLDDEARKSYALLGGPSFSLGVGGAPADTSQMWSKHSGAGWGVFVMDGDGTIYVENHKMAMFHHSSFMAGGNVASAGEIKIQGGKVVGITNKSGHYMPTDADIAAMFQEMESRGVDVSAVTFTSMTTGLTCTGRELLDRF